MRRSHFLGTRPISERAARKSLMMSWPSQDGSRGGVQDPADDVDQRRLAGSIRAQQRENSPLRTAVDVDVLERPEARTHRSSRDFGLKWRVAWGPWGRGVSRIHAAKIGWNAAAGGLRSPGHNPHPAPNTPELTGPLRPRGNAPLNRPIYGASRGGRDGNRHGGTKAGARREPAPRNPAPPPAQAQRGGGSGRSLIRRLVYWCLVLGLWGVIGAAGAFA